MFVVLDMVDAPVLVVGGGAVATRRAAALLDAGARVTLISPTLSPALARRLGPSLTWQERRFHASDLAAAPWRLVAVCVDDAGADAEVVALARARGLNVSSARGGGNVRHVAQRGAGGWRIAVDSGGSDPAAAAALAERLAATIGAA